MAPCGIDITDKVKFGADNVLAVQVDGKGDNLPYGFPFNPIYGGITGDVILHVTDKVYQTLPLYRNLGTREPPYLLLANIDTLDKSATVNIEPEVKNDTAAPQTVTCASTVVDDAGDAVLTLKTSQSAIHRRRRGGHFQDVRQSREGAPLEPRFSILIQSLYSHFREREGHGRERNHHRVPQNILQRLDGPAGERPPALPQGLRAAHLDGVAVRGRAGGLDAGPRFQIDAG